MRDLPREDVAGGVGLTFDDGCESDYTVAFPELVKRGLKATFYVVTSYVGRRGYVQWHHLRELRRYGMEIGSHSATHPCFLDLSPRAMAEELRRSKRTLEDRLGEAVASFSVPFGFVNRQVIAAALAEGFETVCTSQTRLANPQASPRVYGRFAVRRTDSLGHFVGIVARRRPTLWRIALVESGKQAGKRLLGRRVWLAFRRRCLERRG
ncbi:MAG: hypothetical protein KatS3mg131_3783 [Candidatus Tectimicrobiota bacterium]|nr:MAG: hypothetical protein KatS3mg131_3783 [Candidatus Tectomicrobia bacterium]